MSNGNRFCVNGHLNGPNGCWCCVCGAGFPPKGTAVWRNLFDSPNFASFWLLCEREWAEAVKFLMYYPDQACPYCGAPDCFGNCQESALEDQEDENW